MVAGLDCRTGDQTRRCWDGSGCASVGALVLRGVAVMQRPGVDGGEGADLAVAPAGNEGGAEGIRK